MSEKKKNKKKLVNELDTSLSYLPVIFGLVGVISIGTLVSIICSILSLYFAYRLPDDSSEQKVGYILGMIGLCATVVVMIIKIVASFV